MVVQSVLHMNTGNGEKSYANNSYFQKHVIMKSKPLIEHTIKDMFKSGTAPTCFKIADLGCSSGPNTFLAITGIISSVHDLYRSEDRESPEFQVFLNDLPGNDFNAIFKATPEFYEGIKEAKGDKLGRVLVAGVPGSFYDRLFPRNSLDFAHSSTSLHWLSQVPKGIEDNKGCIFISKKSPPHVSSAYAEQFAKDFATFLRVRGEEIVSGGRMALKFFGRTSADPLCVDCYMHWQQLADCLMEMATEGLVKEGDVDAFNLPYYTPFGEEARKIIEEEGSFSILKLDIIEERPYSYSDEEDRIRSGQKAAESLRAVLEPMFSHCFGSAIIDDLFARFAKRISTFFVSNEGVLVVLGISLTRK